MLLEKTEWDALRRKEEGKTAAHANTLRFCQLKLKTYIGCMCLRLKTGALLPHFPVG